MKINILHNKAMKQHSDLTAKARSSSASQYHCGSWMVKGNTIFEGKGPRRERVPNGLQETGGWQECPQPHIQLAQRNRNMSIKS